MGCLKLHIEENYSALKVVHRAVNPVQKVEQGFFFSPEKTDADEYCYGFNGQEKDDEVAGEGNSYTAQFWQYDSRLGRRWNVDPVDKPYESSYAAFSNTPIYFIDPNGDNAGDYYSQNGIYLGSDGEDDDKVYMVNGVDDESAKKKDLYSQQDLKNLRDGKLHTGSTSPTAHDLGITHTEFKFFTGIVKVEESGTWQGSNAIAGATLNNQSGSEEVGKERTITETLNKISTVNNKKSLGTSDNSSNALNSRKGVMHALFYGTDYSNGATHWDGFDFVARGSSHPKGKNQGYTLSKVHSDQIKAVWTDKLVKAYSGGTYTSVSETIKEGDVVSTGYNKGKVLYMSSAVYGRSIFWAPNKNDKRNEGYNWKHYY